MTDNITPVEGASVSDTDVTIQVNSTDKMELGVPSNVLEEIHRKDDAYSVRMSTGSNLSPDRAEDHGSGAVIGGCPSDSPTTTVPATAVAVDAPQLVTVAKIELTGAPSAVLEPIDPKTLPFTLSTASRSTNDSSGRELGDRSVVGDSRARGDEAACVMQPHPRPSPVSSRDVQYALRVDKTRTTRHLDDLRGMYHVLQNLKRDFAESLQRAEFLSPDFAIDDHFQIGYIKPGHGAKGQKMNLFTDGDLAQMYEVCRNRRNDILLWFTIAKEPRIYDSYDMLSPGANGKRRPGSPLSVTGVNAAKRRRMPVKCSSPGVPTMAWQATGVVPSGTGVICTPGTIQAASPQLLQMTAVAASSADQNTVVLTNGDSRGVVVSGCGTSTSSSAEKESSTLPQHMSPLPTSVNNSAARRLSLQTPQAELLVDGRNGTPGCSCDTPAWALQLLKDRAEVRRMLIQQLQEWSSLRQNSVIEEDIYVTHKTKILADLDQV